MNIAYLTDTFLPDVSGGAIRAFHQVEFLHNHGFTITLFSNVKPSNYPWKMVQCKGKSLWQVFPNAGYIPSYVKNFKRQNLSKKFDLIYASMPSFAIAASALWLGKAFKIPFIIEIRDPFIRPIKIGKNETAYLSKDSWKGKILFKLQDKIFSHAKKIVVTNPSIAKEISDMHQIPSEKIEVIYNSPDLLQFKTTEKKSFNSFTILYAGRVLESKNLQSVLRALKNENGKLVVCGEGSPEFLRKIAKEENLEGNLEIVGRLTHQETLKYLLGADVLYVGLDQSPVLEYALPSKVLEYMAAGKPILSIGSPTGDLAELLKKTNSGIHTSSNPEEIKRALTELRKNNELYSKNGLEAVQKEFNTGIQLQKLLKVVNEGKI